MRKPKKLSWLVWAGGYSQALAHISAAVGLTQHMQFEPITLTIKKPGQGLNRPNVNI